MNEKCKTANHPIKSESADIDLYKALTPAHGSDTLTAHNCTHANAKSRSLALTQRM